MVDGRTDVRSRIRRGILRDGGCGAGEGRALNEPVLKADPAALSSAEFFDRARARLRFDVPAGLIDPSIIPRSGDQGNDRMLEIIAREQPIRPAAVLIPVVDHPTADRAADPARRRISTITPARSPFPAARSTRPMLPRSMRRCARPRKKSAWPANSSIRSAISICTEPSFGFRILPTVARVRPGFSLRINRSEVDDAFEVPLAFLMDPANHQAAQQGISRHGALLLRHAVRGTLYLGRNRGNSAGAVRADLPAMIRPALTELGIFLIPFAVYALFLIATRSGLLVQASWPLHIVAKLVLGALLLVIVSFVLLAHFSGRIAEFDLRSRAYRKRQVRSRS